MLCLKTALPQQAEGVFTMYTTKRLMFSLGAIQPEKPSSQVIFTVTYTPNWHESQYCARQPPYECCVVASLVHHAEVWRGMFRA